MKKQTICLALSPCIIAGYLLANNMFSHKPQMQNENISYNEIMIRNKVVLSFNKTSIKPLQNISGINTDNISKIEEPNKEEKVEVKKKETKKVAKKKSYTEEDLMLLAGIIENEAGSDEIEQAHRLAVGSVVLNRVKSDLFPDTISEVIFQKGQYAINTKALYNPSKRSIRDAKYLLENGSTLPDKCLFQSEFRQGSGTYEVFYTSYSTTYICYVD